jgi:hypothetical protein
MEHAHKTHRKMHLEEWHHMIVAGAAGAATAFIQAVRRGRRFAMSLLEAAGAGVFAVFAYSIIVGIWPTIDHLLAVGVVGIACHQYGKVVENIGEIVDTIGDTIQRVINSKSPK